MAVVRRYGQRTALTDFTWTAGRGLVGVLGRNGAGKTTLLRLIVTLLRPTAGKILVNGLDSVREASKIRRLIGYLPQEFQPYPELSVHEFLEYIAALAGLHGASARRDIDRVLELTNLQHVVRARTGTLSGGTRRRLGVAQALLGSPRLLVVDEPTAGLDPEERVRLRQVLAGLGQDMTILLSTHLVEDIDALAHRVVVLDRGRLAFDGEVATLIDRARGRVMEFESAEPHVAQDRGIVSRATPFGGRFKLRVVCQNGVSEGRGVEPSLEDGYLALLGDTRDQLLPR